MSKTDGRVSFEDEGKQKFLQFSVMALEEIEEHYDCSIDRLPEILSGMAIRNKTGQLVKVAPRFEMIGDEYVLDEKGNKIELPPEPPRLKEVVTLFRAGMLEYDEDLTRADCNRMMTRVGVTEVGRMITEAVMRAFPEANADELAAVDKGGSPEKRAAARKR